MARIYARNTLILLFFWGLSNLSSAQFYTGSQQEFGKNRVQYKEFLWQYFSFDKFETYFYAGGRDLAIYTAKTSKTHLAELEELFDFTMEEKVEFVIYNSLSDFRQSNVGLSGEEQYNIGGVTRIVGSKVFLYFEGDHATFDYQIRSGLARVLLNQMMYGGNWKDVIKNSTLLTLPDWYMEGLISYASRDWDVEIDSRVRDGILTGKYDKFNRLEGDDAAMAGHSIWNYIADVYGDNVIPNILYMTRISRNVESGFLFVIGTSLKTLSTEYLSYYRKKYEFDEQIRNTPQQEELVVKTKKTRTYSQYKLSPNGRYAAWVSNELGQYKIWVHDTSTGKTKKIHKGEHKLNRIIDKSYPIIAWHPGGGGFAFITEKKGELLMNIYTIDTKKTTTKTLFKLQKVLDMAYSKDGRSMVFSGVVNGQTDLYLYNTIGNRQTQLTNDIYDDMNPRFCDNGSGIIFSSNRTDDTLRTTKTIDKLSPYNDIFVYDLKNRGLILKRITETPFVHEIHPSQYDSVNYSFISNQNGINNRYVATYDSTVSHIDTAFHYRYFTVTHPVTNYSRNILEYEIQPLRGKYSMLMYKDGKYHFFVGNKAEDKILSDLDVQNTQFMDNRNTVLQNTLSSDQIDTAGVQIVTSVQVFDVDPDGADPNIDIENYSFEGDDPDDPNNQNNQNQNNDAPTFEKEVISFDDNDTTSSGATTVVDTVGVSSNTASATTDDPGKAIPDFILPQQSVYQLNFATDYVVTQVDNTFLNSNYQRYTGPGAIFYNPGFNGLIKLGVSDLFEDHRIIGAVRLSGDFNSNEYFLAYHDLSKRRDKTYLFHRQAIVGVNDFAIVKVHTHQFKYINKWVFSEVSSLRATLNARNDRAVTLATDYTTLQEPHQYHNLGAVKLEYVFDNTIPRGLNLYNGLRFKIFAEYYQEVDRANTDFKVVGFDFRHYLKIHRDLIWANRIAGSTSFGSQKLVYYLGGVDSWLIPRFDASIPVADNQNYAFQTIATPMRGFFQNARNGNSFALLNSELRWPVFKYFMNRPIKSDFVENFMIVGFSDVGTAFTGSDPYSEDNTFNIQTVVQNPLTVTIQNQREPIIWGYGFGLRSRIWGYYIRADWAWGVDDGVILDPLFYLSLSLDF